MIKLNVRIKNMLMIYVRYNQQIKNYNNKFMIFNMK